MEQPVDDGVMNFSLEKYQLIKARSLMALERPGKALECLDEAAERIDSTHSRRRAYLDILRAECYLHLKRPQYERALKLLTGAFHVSHAINSTYNIKYVKRVFKLLSASPYGNAPEVVDLEISLKELRSPGLCSLPLGCAFFSWPARSLRRSEEPISPEWPISQSHLAEYVILPT